MICFDADCCSLELVFLPKASSYLRSEYHLSIESAGPTNG